MKHNKVPEFAIIGHPNEGKSSVVSTLAEDDSVRVSPTPGETIQCRVFPVKIDNQEIIRFVDTPGFQSPKQTLSWLQNYNASSEKLLEAFYKANKDNTIFKDECELFTPVIRGAGIIYVADGSRPMRKADRIEMEILRLTGRPRMAIINNKEQNPAYIDIWKSEFRKNFNSIRVFNAHNATYAERIALLDSLKSIDQDWEDALEQVISAFKKDWAQRNIRTAEIICEMVSQCLNYKVTMSGDRSIDEKKSKESLLNRYKHDISEIEKQGQRQIKRFFKHNLFDYDLPPQSILNDDLFDEKTWKVLGLSSKQLVVAAAAMGGSIGACIDLAAASLTFGIFTAIGGAVGAGSALFGAEKMAKIRLIGKRLGKVKMQVGPNENLQFLYILIDRALIYYSHVINWSHGRRDYELIEHKTTFHEKAKKGFSSQWHGDPQKVCNSFFKALRGSDEVAIKKAKKDLIELLKTLLERISKSQRSIL